MLLFLLFDKWGNWASERLGILHSHLISRWQSWNPKLNSVTPLSEHFNITPYYFLRGVPNVN